MWATRVALAYHVLTCAVGTGSTGEAEVAAAACHTAVPGERCWKAVLWARTKGIVEHPAWYPGLTRSSSVAAFQAVVHHHDPGRCPRPCSEEADPSPPPPVSVLPPRPTLVAPGTAVPARQGTSGVYLSNRNSTAYTWTAGHQNFVDMLRLPFQGGWSNPFGLSVRRVARWLRDDLLASSPFDGVGVLVPGPESGGDQLGDGGWVTYSRRQVCYITAKAYFGSTTPGYDSGLARLMNMCKHGGDFRVAFASLLAACAADPTLKNGGQGPMLVVAKAEAAPSVDAVRQAAVEAPLSDAGLRVCEYDTGSTMDSVEQVPHAGCVPRSATKPGKDFMTGGLKGQATQDISAAWFGGYLFDAHACGLGGGQDERLSVYFPEVTVLAYFLSSSHPFPQLRQPVWVLGARNFFTGLDGTARFDRPLELAPVPMDSDLVNVEVAGSTHAISSSRPFLVFMSESQGYFGESREEMQQARTNRLPLERDMGHGKFAFEKQVRAWYRSVALTSYAQEVQPALKALVSSIGAGPWLAGLWFGDSQLGILAMWLGQAIAAPTWGTGQQPLPLDYYIYSDFTENPGNQCFVLAKDACAECMSRCESPSPKRSSFWLPETAYMDGEPCVTTASLCGTHGLQDIIAAFKTRTAAELWSEMEAKLADGSVDETVFDELLQRELRI